MDLRLVVGLGNPGERYARTRHNVGFRVVEHLAGEDAAWKEFQGLGRFTKSESLYFAEPTTFMNESGRFVQAFAAFHKMAPQEVLVCFDDIALLLGRLRIKRAGSSGGQKGMLSIIRSLGTEEIPRLRVGIGPQPEGWDAADFVLSRFGSKEEPKVGRMLAASAEAVKTIVADGIEAAMNRFNPPPDEEGGRP